ncbi:hypothetical protein PUN4_780064 [Paraburkholderia unamae]|nr:hypothetical protein PUN4_780064 [Paraburkholderia unamae]
MRRSAAVARLSDRVKAGAEEKGLARGTCAAAGDGVTLAGMELPSRGLRDPSNDGPFMAVERDLLRSLSITTPPSNRSVRRAGWLG